jgi:P27 family predicted phage terminase small subunit
MGSRGPLSAKAKQGALGATLLTRVPKPPRGLGAEGRAEWRRVAAELGPRGRNVLTAAAVGLLEDLARAADDAARFRRIWKKEGETVSGQGREFPHPMIIQEDRSRAVVHRLRRELGVTPASVVRVPHGPAVEEEEDPDDPLAGM